MTEAKIADACGRIRSRDDAAVVVTAAVASERERCARIAERCYKHSYQGIVVQTQRLIAAAIRNEE